MANQAGLLRSANRWPDRLGARTLFYVLGAAVVLATLILVLDATATGWPSISGRLTMLLAVSGAAATLGSLIGFVFGIPRRLTTNSKPVGSEGNAAVELYESNTNLEQVSDWLTKIIIGITLVQLGPIITTVGQYGSEISARTKIETDAPLAVGIMIFFFVCGFIATYLWARLFLRLALTQADERRLNELEQQYQRDARALDFCTRWIDQPDTAPPREEVERGIVEGSPSMRATLLYRAEENRERNRARDKKQMDRSTAIFEALYKVDGTRNHRVPANLAYALKDGSPDPPWDRVEALLTEAIALRSGGYSVYEAVRAIARINISRQPELVREDLDTAFRDQWVTRWLRDETVVVRWAETQNYPLPP